MISKRTIVAALLLASAGPASASHQTGFCVRANNVAPFTTADRQARQFVVPGEPGLIIGFAHFGPPGTIAVLWNKSFDIGGKDRALNLWTVQDATQPSQIEVVECARHTMEGTEVSPWQGPVNE